jgi:adenylate cyclase
VSVNRVRRQIFAPRQQGVPADLAMYRVKAQRDVSSEDEPDSAE